jgi:hypothetical protein
MFTAQFWMSAGERSVKTAAQVLIVFLGADLTDVFGVDWRRAAGIAVGAALVSVLTSLASSQVGESKGTPSLVGEGDRGAGEVTLVLIAAAVCIVVITLAVLLGVLQGG